MTEIKTTLNGTVRAIPEDFVVEEIWDTAVVGVQYSLTSRLKDELFSPFRRKKEYLHFTFVKWNWDTIRALNYIRKKIGVSLKRFGIAGLKDKRALTSQRVSLWKGRIATMARLRLPDMLLKDFQYADSRINLGDAFGNRFTITIRNVPTNKEETVDILRRFQEVATSQGIPNYFGPQRLSGNVDAGTALKNGDLKRATELILKKVQPHLQKGGVETIPRVFWYEKRMIRHLEKYPNDYAGALRTIPKRIRRLYVHAYQSNLFNHQLQQALTTKTVPNTITVQGFPVPKMPELTTTTFKRRSLLVARDFRVLSVRNGTVKLRFMLNRGEYASTLLSYLLKGDRA